LNRAAQKGYKPVPCETLHQASAVTLDRLSTRNPLP
jgi:hypothetical protein